MAVQYLRKLICLFYKDYHDKATTTPKIINTPSPIVKLTNKPAAKLATKAAKQKLGWPANSLANKVKKTELNFLSCFLKNKEKLLSRSFTWILSTFSYIFKAWLNNLQFSSLVSHWIRRFFIDWFSWFSSSVFHWVRRFFTKLSIVTIAIINLTASGEYFIRICMR